MECLKSEVFWIDVLGKFQSYQAVGAKFPNGVLHSGLRKSFKDHHLECAGNRLIVGQFIAEVLRTVKTVAHRWVELIDEQLTLLIDDEIYAEELQPNKSRDFFEPANVWCTDIVFSILEKPLLLRQ